MNKDIKHTGGYGWQGDFEASMSDDGSWSASVSYVAPPGEKFTPSYSLHCHVPGFTDLTLSGYLTLLREYKAEIVMIVGFVAAAIMYHDMRTFINEQTRALSEINLRLSNLEQQSRK